MPDPPENMRALDFMEPSVRRALAERIHTVRLQAELKVSFKAEPAQPRKMRCG